MIRPTADLKQLDRQQAGRAMHQLMSRLFPICRSMTGDGVRETLAVLKQRLPLSINEVPTGTQVFDWQVPQEWNIRDAYIRDDAGRRVVDFCESNLHVVGGSMPIRRRLRWPELKQHLYSLPEHPDWIPYRTCFHEENWGFCLAHRQYEQLQTRGDVEYEVVIDATLRDGWLTYGELLLPGDSASEVLFSAHVCHPSLANDNLSGIAVAVQLAEYLQQRPKRYSYRFLFAPATIGAITWLALNKRRVSRIKHGLILSLLGDSGATTYKRSRRGNAEIDRAVAHVLQHSGARHSIVDFEPVGYDERQYCSPGFDLPVGCLMRTPNGRFPQYHTSADDLEFVRPQYLADSLAKCISIVDVLENNRTYVSQNPLCEPRLGKRGLYRAFGCDADQALAQRAMQWALNLADSKHTLLDMAERSGIEFSNLRRATQALLVHGLLKESPGRFGRATAPAGTALPHLPLPITTLNQPT